MNTGTDGIIGMASFTSPLHNLVENMPGGNAFHINDNIYSNTVEYDVAGPDELFMSPSHHRQLLSS